MFVVNRFTSELGITVANYIETGIVTAQVAVQYKTGRVLTDILIVIQLSLTRRVDSVEGFRRSCYPISILKTY